MLGQIAIGTLVVAEIGLTTYTLNKLGMFDGIKNKVTGYTNKVKSEYYKGRYPKEYAAFIKEHSKVVTTWDILL